MQNSDASTEIVTAAPNIIEAAAKSPLGIFALLVLILGFLAYVYFKNATVRVKATIFCALLLGVFLYGFSLSIEARRDTAITIRGLVFDEKSSGLENVQVDSAEQVAPELTDGSGIFVIQFHLSPEQTRTVLSFSKNGYAPRRLTVTPPVPNGLVVQLSKVDELPSTQTDSQSEESSLGVLLDPTMFVYYQRNGRLSLYVSVGFVNKSARASTVLRGRLLMRRTDSDKTFEQQWTGFSEISSGKATLEVTSAGPVTVGPTSVVGKMIQFRWPADSPELLLLPGQYRWELELWTNDTGSPSISVTRTFSVEKRTADTLLARRQRQDNTYSPITFD